MYLLGWAGGNVLVISIDKRRQWRLHIVLVLVDQLRFDLHRNLDKTQSELPQAVCQKLK